MNEDDYWVDKIKGDYWCVYHISMEKPIKCFLKKKQATTFMQEEMKRNSKPIGDGTKLLPWRA